jgi:lipoprotein-anchoring transpeptidase ErfK/SrfK
MRTVRPAFAASALSIALLAIQSPASAQTSYYSNPAAQYYADPGSRYQASIFRNVAPRQDAVEDQDTVSELPTHLRRQIVSYQTSEAAGTIVIDTPNTYLYYVLGGGRAIRYGIGVGRDGFRWSGTQNVGRKAEWPDWNPPPEMIARQPYLPRFMAGGPTNPLGARAMYLGNTIYRIHGTNAPSTIGSRVSSGCIRLTNEDVTDLYNRVKIGAKVVVMPDRGRAPSIAKRTGPQNSAQNESRPAAKSDQRQSVLIDVSSAQRTPSAPAVTQPGPAVTHPAPAATHSAPAVVQPSSVVKNPHPIDALRI